MKILYLILIAGLLIVPVFAGELSTIIQPTDKTIYDEKTNTCSASNNGFNLIVENCKAKDWDGRDITQTISFYYNGLSLINNPELEALVMYDEKLESSTIHTKEETEEDFELSNSDYLGSNLLTNNWEYYKVFDNLISKDKSYINQWAFTPKKSSGKYRIFLKFKEDTIQEAIKSGNYLYLDPWWDDICGDFQCANTTWSLGNNWTVNNVSGKAVFSTTTPTISYITQDVGLLPTKREYNITLNVLRTWYNWTEFWVELGGVNSSKFTTEGEHTFYHMTNGTATNLTIWANRTYSETINAYLVLDNVTIVNSGRFLEVDFDTETPDNESIIYVNSFYVNNTICGVEFFENITYYLYNSTHSLINETNYNNPTYQINYTNLSDGNYYFNISVRSFDNNISSTETRQIRIEATPIVSWCRELWKDNTVYTQTQDIEASGNTNCIYIYGTNITFEGNGFKIINGGVYATQLFNSTINNTISNKITVETASNNLIKNNLINDCSNECLKLGDNYANTIYNIFENNILNNSNDNGINFRGVSLFGINLGASHNIFKENQYLNISNYDIYMPTIAEFMVSQFNKNNTFIDDNYTSEYVSGTNNQLTRKWYYSAYVNDSNGNDVNGASILIYNQYETLDFNLSTNSTGETSRVEVTEYFNNAGSIIYYSNYSIIARDVVGHSASNVYNVSLEKNFEDVLTLSCDYKYNNILVIPVGCISKLNEGELLKI